MALNRLKEMWHSNEETGQAYLFQPMDDPPAKPKSGQMVERLGSPRSQGRAPRMVSSPLKMTSSGAAKVDGFLQKCMEVVEKDPEVALEGPVVEWETWFTHPLLCQVRRSGLPVGAKQRLLAFMALMSPFLDNREMERVRDILVDLAPPGTGRSPDMLTEQDLLHSQWLVRAVRRSRNIQMHMNGLRRSIIRSLPAFALD